MKQQISRFGPEIRSFYQAVADADADVLELLCSCLTENKSSIEAGLIKFRKFIS